MSTTTTITLPTGHRFDYSQDIDVINPFDDTGHCEPPIAVVNLDVRGQETIDNYAGEELNLNTLLSRLTPEQWADEEALIAALPWDRETIAAYGSDGEDFQEQVRNTVAEETPYGMTQWQAYFSSMAAVAALASIPCYNTVARGYCQGDVALVFVLATPEWQELVGAPTETLERQCRGAANLWAAWAYGDVYYVDKVRRPDGTVIEDSSCGEFYGSDHKENGMTDFVEGIIAADERYQVREAKEAHEAACRDIATA